MFRQKVFNFFPYDNDYAKNPSGYCSTIFLKYVHSARIRFIYPVENRANVNVHRRSRLI